MHTFFVNTSKRSLNYYDILFDICTENMNLVPFVYPMSQWYSSNEGYLACANEMAKAIDTNIEITNEFNLVVYIDLCEIKQYTGLVRGEERKRAACLNALRRIYLHIVKKTIVKALEDDGRSPINTLVMFGEDKKIDETAFTKDAFQNEITETMMGFFGLPVEASEIRRMAQPVCDSNAENKLQLLKETTAALNLDTTLPAAVIAYAENIDHWHENIISYKDAEYAFEQISILLEKQYEAEKSCGNIQWVSCPCDSYAFSRNKAAHAVVQLSIASYLAECIYSETVLDTTGHPRPFVLYDAAVLAEILDEKKQVYACNLREIEDLSRTYAELKLAPALQSLDNTRFGLDERGRIRLNEEDEDVGQKGLDKPLLPIERFAHQEENEQDPSGTDPKPFRQAAKKLKEHSENYLGKLHDHTHDTLANYAGDSTGNYQAVLEKRRVSVGDSNVADKEKPKFRKYTAAQPKLEKDKIEVVRTRSKTAYESAVRRYLAFCTARSVEITDIRAQFEWLGKRIDRIEESLNKLMAAGITALWMLCLLYLPFIVIQWETIMSNMLTPMVALASVALPICALLVVYLVLAVRQKKAYGKAWHVFKAQYLEAVRKNEKAALLYDLLLSEIIPTLRWLYEYKLDVEFYEECCKLARVKTQHHAAKLRERVEAIGNIIEDLEVSDDFPPVRKPGIATNVELNVSYCTGEKNKKYYAIFNTDVLKKLRSGKEG